MRKLLTVICVLLFIGTSNAQEEEKKERKFAIGFSGGTGVGVDLSYKMNKYFSISAKYDVLKYKQEDFDYEIDGEDLLVDGEFDFSHSDLLLNIAPFGKAFRFVVGAGYFTTSQLDVTMSFTEDVSVGDVVFTTDDVGNIFINAEWGEVLPYLGIAFGRAVPKSGFGFGLNLGFYYDSDGPEMTLDATGLIEGTKDQQVLLQDSFSENKFLPNASLRLAFSF